MLDFTINWSGHIIVRKLEVVKIPKSAREAHLIIELAERTLLRLTRILNNGLAGQRR